MNDISPKGTGNSRYLKSSIPANTTWEQFLNMLRNGTFSFDFNGINPSGVTDSGTPLCKNTLFDSENDVLYELMGDDAVPNEAFHILGEERKKTVFFEEIAKKTTPFTNFTFIEDQRDYLTGHIAYGNGIFVSIKTDPGTDQELVYSKNGFNTWSYTSHPWNDTNDVSKFRDIAYVCGHFIATRNETATNPKLLVSKDGKTFTETVLNWNLADDDRLNSKHKIIGCDDWGFIFADDEYSVYSTAILITKSGDDLNFEKITFKQNYGASYNDGHYVEYYKNDPVRRIYYTTGNPSEDKISVATPSDMSGSGRIKNCIYCNGYIIMVYKGYSSSEYTTISVYNTGEETWTTIYGSSNNDSFIDSKSIGNTVLILCTNTSYIVDTETLQAFTFSTMAGITAGDSNICIGEYENSLLTSIGANSSDLCGTYVSNYHEIKEYKLTDLLGDFIGNGVKIETGSYIGTGTYGKSNPNELTFEFEPKLVIIHQDTQLNGYSSYGICITKSKTMFRFSGNESDTSTNYGVIHTNLNGKNFSYYDTSSSEYQFNTNNILYNYIAID